MIEELAGDDLARCDSSSCDRPLPDEPSLVYRTDGGERRAYECACGGVTVTVVDQSN